MARQPAAGARDRILDVASRLFLEHGVHPVGLQQIIDECGCGKNLLYTHFASKDELVVAYLRRCRREWEAIIGQAIQQAGDSPAGQLVAVVRAVGGQVCDPGYRSSAARTRSPAPSPSPRRPSGPRRPSAQAASALTGSAEAAAFGPEPSLTTPITALGGTGEGQTTNYREQL